MVRKRAFVGLAAAALITVGAWAQTHQSPAVPLSKNAQAVELAARGALGRPALVEFYSDECQACRSIMGQMDELDQRFYGKIKFIYMDADRPETLDYLGRYNVRGLPTLALLDADGKVAATIAGWPGEAVVVKSLDEMLRN